MRVFLLVASLAAAVLLGPWAGRRAAAGARPIQALCALPGLMAEILEKSWGERAAALGGHLGATAFHLEAQEARCGAHFENALACKIDVAQIAVGCRPQIPFTADGAVTGNVHDMIEDT